MVNRYNTGRTKSNPRASLSLRCHAHRPLAKRLMHMVHVSGNTSWASKSSSDWLNYTGFPGDVCVVFFNVPPGNKDAVMPNPLTKEESRRVYKCDGERLSGSTKCWTGSEWVLYSVCDRSQVSVWLVTAVCDQCNGWWEMQSGVMCNSLCGVRVNMMERQPQLEGWPRTGFVTICMYIMHYNGTDLFSLP